MNYVFCGDLHGRMWNLNRFLERYENSDYTKILTGDYIDSFNRPIAEQIKLLNTVIALSKRDDFVVLFGNHELSYLEPNIHGCSGKTAAMSAHMVGAVGTKSFDTFDTFFYDVKEKLLVSHAGFSARLGYKFASSFLIGTEEVMEEIDKSSNKIGKARGGFDECGGIFWCDYYREFVPIQGLKQVFGHTPVKVKGIPETQDGQNWNIDCIENGKESQFLIYEDGKFRLE